MNEFFHGTFAHSGNSSLNFESNAVATFRDIRATESSSVRKSNRPGLRPARTDAASRQKALSNVTIRSSLRIANSATSASLAESRIKIGSRKHFTMPCVLQASLSLLLPESLSNNTFLIVTMLGDLAALQTHEEKLVTYCGQPQTLHRFHRRRRCLLARLRTGRLKIVSPETPAPRLVFADCFPSTHVALVSPDGSDHATRSRTQHQREHTARNLSPWPQPRPN